MTEAEIVGGFYLESDPYSFAGFREIVEKLNDPATELPLDVEVNTPWGTQENLRITHVDREHMEDGDLMVEALLGEKNTPIRIYWQEEIEDAQVESGVSLASELYDLAERHDILPPVIRNYERQFVYEVNEAPFESVRELSTLLSCGDQYGDLGIMLAIYGDKKATALLKDALPKNTSEYSGLDANMDPILKFIPLIMTANDFYALTLLLQQINSEAEITLDITIIWDVN